MRDRSHDSLNALNLFVAAMQTGFGAFLPLYLADHGWTAGGVGAALGIGTAAAVVAQVPGGMLVDWTGRKRAAAAAAIVLISLAAVAIGIGPTRLVVFIALAAQGAASAVLNPAIAAVSLAIAPPGTLGDRFGRNVRFQALGSAAAALAMGLMGTLLSPTAILALAALGGLAALAALTLVAATAVIRSDHAAIVPSRLGTHAPKRAVAAAYGVLIFALVMALFQLGNAGMLPVVTHRLADQVGRAAAVVLAAGIAVPQLIGAAIAPAIGRLAEASGRRRVLMLGLLPLPLRAALFALPLPAGAAFIPIQAMDGISAAVLGTMVPLIAADLTRHSGRFNLALGVIGLAGSLGSVLSTAGGGALATRAGTVPALGLFMLCGTGALALTALMLPETSRHPISHPPQHGAIAHAD